VADAHELAVALREVARSSGVACEALITDMNQPLGLALGTASEVRAAHDVLSGPGHERLREVTVRLSQQAMVLRGLDPADSLDRLEESLASGSALAKWHEMIEAHGGDPDPDRLPRPVETREIVADRTGAVTGVAAADLGRVAAAVGAGRNRRDEPLAFGAGVTVCAGIGDLVQPGTLLAVLEIGDRPIDTEVVCHRIRAAFEIGEDRPQVPTLVLGTADEVDPADRSDH